VSEARSEYAFVSQSTRLWAGAASVEVEWSVGPVDVADGLGREVVTRYSSSGLGTNATWRSDSNCRESVERRRNVRRTNATITEPVSANYYPTACLVSISSSGTSSSGTSSSGASSSGTSSSGTSSSGAAAAATLAIALDRAEGSSSLADGELELLVHRRLLHDDGRGVGENLNEPGLDGKGLVIRGRHWLVLAPAASAPAMVREAQQHALALPLEVRAFAPLGALSPAQWLAGHRGGASLLVSSLPTNVHLATVHARGGGALLLRLSHTFEAGEDAVLSQNATVPLARLFAGRTVASAVEMTLPGLQPLADVPQRTFVTDAGERFTVPVLPAPPIGADMDVVLAAMQIRTFLVQLVE
jgi:lysosomal alpha-mannosidase